MTEKEKNVKGTFVAEILCEEYATWQGRVIWADQNKQEYFRSTFELMKLVDDAIHMQVESFKDSNIS